MITLSDLRARIKTQDEDRLEELRSAVLALWDAKTGRKWQREEGIVELHRCTTMTRRFLVLERRPVEVVTKVEQTLAASEWTELDVDDWFFDGVGTVEKVNGYWYRLARVTYTAGFTAEPADASQNLTPADIKDALLTQALFLHERNNPEAVALRSNGLENSQTDYLAPDLHPHFKQAALIHRRKGLG